MILTKDGFVTGVAEKFRQKDSMAFLTVLYVLALSLIAFFNVLILLLVGGYLDEMSSDALVINHAGRQRMLSQKIVKEVFLLTGSGKPEEREKYRLLLADTVAKWSRVHEGLQHGDRELQLPGNNSRMVERLFGDINPQFAAIQTVVQEILTLDAAGLAEMKADSPLMRKLIQPSAMYLPFMETAVSLFEEEARARVEAQRRRKIYSVVAVLMLLWFEAIFIFRPMSRKVRSTVMDLRAANANLEHDIAKRAEVEEALRKSDAGLREAQQIAHVGSFEWEVKANQLFLSDEVYKILGIEKRPHLEFHEFLASVFPDDRRLVEKEMEGFFSENKVFDAEYRIVKQNGEVRDVHAMGKPKGSDGNAPTSVKGTMQDITERKVLESQIRHAQKMEAIGNLAGGIAHDFNNLLQAITGNLALLLAKIDASHPFYEDLSRISTRIDSGSELTRQLLGFARGGKYVVRPTNLNKLLQNTSEMFGRTHRDLSIHGKYEPNIWSAKVDQGQIEQVVLNLLVNAQHAMPNGGKIFLETENVILDSEFVKPHQAHPGKFVKVSVVDTGTGINPEISHRIFDPFFTTRNTGQGFGLGLASCYGIVKNHGGIITFSSSY